MNVASRTLMTDAGAELMNQETPDTCKTKNKPTRQNKTETKHRS